MIAEQRRQLYNQEKHVSMDIKAIT